jgi:molybdopterin-guanine dinucleotide biosynthesis protein A
MGQDARLPVHGFVLAGGKSSRMGVDKALLRVGGRTMVEIAVEKLREICAQVSVVGTRDDLGEFAPVVHDLRVGEGPAAGIEAGLVAAHETWVMFVPVDVPLVPVELLRDWAEAVVQQEDAGCGASLLVMNRERQPAFCMMRRECLGSVRSAMERGVRRVNGLLDGIDDDATVGWLWACDAARFVGDTTEARIGEWFLNVNTPEELAEAEAWAASNAVR